jgi:TMEM175 potassium channel family protein
MYPKVRIDALTDGIFAVAMTILVLDLRLPEDFHPVDNGAMAGAILGLWPKFFPYALSFYVLGSIWLAATKLRTQAEFFDKSYVSWWLMQLLLATCLPFSSSVLGRFASHAPSVWLYCANMAALAAVGLRLVTLTPGLEDDAHTLDRKVSLVILMGTSLLCFGLSLINPGQSLWVYALNVTASPIARQLAARRVGHHG